MLLEISLAASPESFQPAAKKRWQWWYWAALPLLAFIAYYTVLRVGFLGDDFVLLGWAKEPGVDMQALLPGSRWFFYRPVGVFLYLGIGLASLGLQSISLPPGAAIDARRHSFASRAVAGIRHRAKANGLVSGRYLCRLPITR